jgi:hypothetical protein
MKWIPAFAGATLVSSALAQPDTPPYESPKTGRIIATVKV